jgi:DNA polymerase I|tara:strand:+ start:621 stop:2882 length:2262 start_codon:yes stop_codon:yes gene_type:complete
MALSNLYILAIDYFVHPTENIPVVRVYGKTEDNEVLTLYDDTFKPYFYLRDPSKYDYRMIGTSGAQIVGSVELEHEGKKIKCAKVETRKPADVARLRDRLLGRNKDVFSADILFPLRYAYDKDIKVFAEIEYDDEHSILSIKKGTHFEPQLSVLTYDIEASLRTREVYCISANINGEKTITFDDENGERQMLDRFCDWVLEENPDIITGYNIFGFDFPMLEECAKRNGTSIRMGRGEESPWSRKDNKRRINVWNLTGRILVDTWQQVKQELKPIQESLAYVGELLEVGSKDDVDASRIEEEWKNRREDVIKYCEKDTLVTWGVFDHEKIASLPKAIALSIATNLPLEHCFSPVTTRLADSILIRKFDKAGFAVPQNTWGEKTKKIKGATVFDVHKPGIYTNVAILDFKSMYPSVIIKNNICPSTYTKSRMRGDYCIRSPLGALFRQKGKGILPEVLESLWKWRDEVKAQVKEGGDYNDRLQYSIKVLMNSFYGVMASSFYRFTNPKIGGSVTAFARRGIQKAYDKLGELGNTVIYGDTDSVFVQLKDEDPHELAKVLSEEGMEMEVEKILKTFFTHGAKKRYAALVEWPKEEFYVKGYELRRGDSFVLQRDAMRGALDRILENEPDKAFKYVSRIVKMIKEGETDKGDLVITKNVRSPKDYVNPDSMPGVQAALKLKARGFPWVPGTKISWIVTSAKKSPMEVEPYIDNIEFTAREDREYYAGRIVHTLSDIAAVFDWDDIGLSSGTKQERLF